MADPNIVVSPLISNPTPNPDGQVFGSKMKTKAAAGTTQATAAAITSNEGDVILVTNNTAVNGVILPSLCAGKNLIVTGALAAVCLVYPPVGGSINYGTVNAPITQLARRPGHYIAIDDLNYICITDAIT